MHPATRGTSLPRDPFSFVYGLYKKCYASNINKLVDTIDFVYPITTCQNKQQIDRVFKLLKPWP